MRRRRVRKIAEVIHYYIKVCRTPAGGAAFFFACLAGCKPREGNVASLHGERVLRRGSRRRLYTAAIIRASAFYTTIGIVVSGCGKRKLLCVKWGSRNLVGITIQLSDSEEEEFFVGYPMLISPEKFDFGIERFGCGI